MLWSSNSGPHWTKSTMTTTIRMNVRNLYCKSRSFARTVYELHRWCPWAVVRGERLGDSGVRSYTTMHE